MDWWTTLAASIALLWLLCFIDGKRTWLEDLWKRSSSKERCGDGLPSYGGNAVLELRLLFHALTKAACHLYLAALPLRRAVLHFARSMWHLVNPGPPPAKKGSLHFLEGLCVVCETAPNLMGAALSLGAAFCHVAQGTLFLLACTLRSVQVNLLHQVDGLKERWEKEQNRAKEEEKRQNAKVVEYLSVYCQDPVTSLRLKVDK